MARLAVLTSDVLSDRMAGPAVRATHVAGELSATHEVVLVTTAACSYTDPRFRAMSARGSALRSVLADVEVIVLQGPVTLQARWVLHTDKIIVVDLYDPTHLEQLELHREAPARERDDNLDLAVRVLNEQLLRGDFFLCASEQQRHLWTGHLAALGRVNTATYDDDPGLSRLIAICPFGLADEPPVRTRPALRGVVDGIGDTDTVVIWAGGIYNWFDPLTLIRAVAALAPVHPDLRLFFLGLQHPNPDVPQMAMARRARELADELGVAGTSVFFNTGWVDYADRQNYLLDADVGVSTHRRHLETEYAFRTRMLDYLWAGLPIVATEGDSFAELINARGLGRTAPEGDVDALAAALASVAYDAEVQAVARAAVADAAEQFRWSRTLAPLVSFCANPTRAADAARRPARYPVPARSPLVHNAQRAVSVLRSGGVRALTGRLRRR